MDSEPADIKGMRASSVQGILVAVCSVINEWGVHHLHSHAVMQEWGGLLFTMRTREDTMVDLEKDQGSREVVSFFCSTTCFCYFWNSLSKRFESI
jgi:hypothetical protein